MRSSISFFGIACLGFSIQMSAAPSANLPFDGVAPGHSVTNAVIIRATNNVAGLQCDVLFDSSRLICTNHPELVSGPAGVVVDGAPMEPGRYRLLAYSPTGVALTNDVLCDLVFNATANAANGQAPLRSSTVIFGDTGATAIATGIVNPGLILVGDAFGFVPGGGRAQFRAVAGSNYVIQASADLNKWTSLATNAATEELVWTMDTNAPALAYRFYRTMVVP